MTAPASSDLQTPAQAELSATEQAPAPSLVVIQPVRGWKTIRLRELWEFRDLLYFLVRRDVTVRYKETSLGVLWMLFQPLMTLLIFSTIFGLMGVAPSDGIPYPVFVCCGLIPWQFFMHAVCTATNSLVANRHLVTRVYFPRLILPLAAILASLADVPVTFALLLGLLLWYGILPGAAALTLGLFLVLAAVAALAVGIWLSALSARYRDVHQVVPALMQFWLYATPIVYSSSLIPERWRPLLGLNPMAQVTDGFRWALLGAARPSPVLLAVSAAIVGALLVTGLRYFRQVERELADLV